MTKKITAFLVILLIMAFDLSHAGIVRKEFEKSYSFKSGSQLILSNVNGEVRILSWDKDQVKVQAKIKVTGGSQRELDEFIKQVEIEIDQGSNFLKIKANYPERGNGSGFLDWIFGGGKPEINIDYVLNVPQKSDLDIKTVNGNIEVQAIEGKINLKSTNGQIEAQDLRGSIEAKTVNGAIEIDVLELSPGESISFGTVNGSIDLRLPPEIKATVDASCVNGSIETDFPLTISGKFVGKKVQGEINGGGASISLKTVNGSIQLLEK